MQVAPCLLLMSLAGCGEVGPAPDNAPPDETGPTTSPWRRTEERAACASHDPLRQSFFGDLHIHTRYSADASLFGTRVGPRDAYDFARGEPILLADDDELQTRTARIDRPLDFAAVTDHVEFFGEVDLCSTPGSAVYDEPLCQDLRKPEHPDDRFLTTVSWLFPLGVPKPPRSHAFCAAPGVDCDAQAASVWGEMRAAAEQFYDRSPVCAFTTFVGYEHTASPIGRHMHRNVIFRNGIVPRVPAGQLDTAPEDPARGLWSALERDCLDAATGCDALAIPHNPNLSGGRQFEDPLDAADARRRSEREPLVEIHQVKGNSECRFDRIAGQGVGTEDELCAFEQMAQPHEGPDAPAMPPVGEYPPRNLVRNALKAGLGFEATLGANPFRFGFVGSTDTHNGTAGAVAEAGWPGAQGNSDSSPARRISRELRTNPGGLVGVWAEENSRDAIFAALARREVFATSGPRIGVRFFAGNLLGVACDSAEFLRLAYETGTPMGGEIGAVRGKASPRFAVLAAKDAGTTENPGADLASVQLVKGWIDANGEEKERVVRVGGEVPVGETVDAATCTPLPGGTPQICAVFEDPEFDPAERAFYYVRVLERPSCRWSTRVCQAEGVNPFAADCATQATRAGAAFASCCLADGQDPFLTPLVSERAWSSPIWYQPEGIAALRGGFDFHARRSRASLDFGIVLGELPAGFEPGRDPITLELADGATFLEVRVPTGGLVEAGQGVIGGRRRRARAMAPSTNSRSTQRPVARSCFRCGPLASTSGAWRLRTTMSD